MAREHVVYEYVGGVNGRDERGSEHAAHVALSEGRVEVTVRGRRLALARQAALDLAALIVKAAGSSSDG